LLALLECDFDAQSDIVAAIGLATMNTKASASSTLHVLQLKVLRKPMLAPKGDEQYVIKGNRDLKWACIDGRRLTSRTGALPAKRVCGLHAAVVIQVQLMILSRTVVWVVCLEHITVDKLQSLHLAETCQQGVTPDPL